MIPSFVFLVALWVPAFNLDYMVLGEDSSEVLPSPTLCLNCTVCQHPCHPLPPPSPLSGYPSYGAPPPPSLSSYPSYGAPPPPSRPVQANRPPVPVQCCQYPSNSNPYEYEPSSTPYLPLSTFSIVILLLLFAVLF
ncbi:hypothetical protein CRYUN_Cryun39dG0008600 [Craigia yunnanensis]